MASRAVSKKMLSQLESHRYLVLAVLLCVFPSQMVAAQSPAVPEQTTGYQGQTTPANLGEGKASAGNGELTYENVEEDFPEPEEGFASEGLDKSAFKEIWAQRGLAMQRGDRSQEYRLLSQLQHKKDAAGWPNLFQYGQVLAREAVKAQADGSYAAAYERASAAIALAPQHPGVQAIAGKVLVMAPERRLEGAAALGRSLFLSVTEPAHQRVRGGQLLFALWLSVLCASLLFGFIMALRSCGRMHAAVLDRLPGGTPNFQAALVVILLLATPVLFGFGVTLSLVWWLTFSGFWMRQPERLATVLVLIWMTLLPLTLPFALGHLHYPGSESELVYMAGRDMGNEALDVRLDNIQDPSPRILFLRGMRDYWRGDTGAALTIMEQAALMPDAGAEVFTALGNLRFRDGQKTRAIQSYDKALAIDSNRVVALFNKSRVLYKMADHSMAGAAHEAASDIDLAMVTRLSERAQDADMFFVADEPIAGSLLSVGAWDRQVDDNVADSFWSRFSPYERLHSALLGLVGLLLSFITLFAKQTLERAEDRSRAKGFVRSRTSDHLEPVERSVQIRKQIREHRRQARLRRLRRVLGLMMAGGAHMVYGAPLSGLLFSCVFVTSLLLYLVSIDLLPALIRFDDAALSLFGIPLGLFVVCVYILSILMRPEEDW